MHFTYFPIFCTFWYTFPYFAHSDILSHILCTLPILFVLFLLCTCLDLCSFGQNTIWGLSSWLIGLEHNDTWGCKPSRLDSRHIVIWGLGPCLLSHYATWGLEWPGRSSCQDTTTSEVETKMKTNTARKELRIEFDNLYATFLYVLYFLGPLTWGGVTLLMTLSYSWPASKLI